MGRYGRLKYEKHDFLTSDENKKLKSIIEERNKVDESEQPWYMKNGTVDKLEYEYDFLTGVGNYRRKYGW